MMNTAPRCRLLFRLQPFGLPLRGQATQKAASGSQRGRRLAATAGRRPVQGVNNGPCFSILIQEYFVLLMGFTLVVAVL